jgi:S-methylmethionine-dependent homocysteine/selenocysteine methylase
MPGVHNRDLESGPLKITGDNKMVNYRHNLPQLGNDIFACYTGMDTELLYNRGIDLPGFASYPLLLTLEGKNILREYYSNLVELAREQNVGVILDSVTWAANRDRGAELGYSPDDLKKFNIDAIELIAGVREEIGDLPTVLCGDIGPRGDGYAPSDLMSLKEAESYHAEQIAVYASTEADIVCAFTLCYVEEAIGVVRAAQRYNMPIAIAFTVETNGRLPTGMPLQEAIEKVDAESDCRALYYLINCAHPDHFTGIFNDEPWMQRLRGVVANASRCSHAELEVADELDEGNPDELGALVGGLRKPYPHFNILGGCCGSDMRHMKSILEAAKSAY